MFTKPEFVVDCERLGPYLRRKRLGINSNRNVCAKRGVKLL
jgi:hypothetical protein